MRDVPIDLDIIDPVVLVGAVQVQHACVLGIDGGVVIIEEGWHCVTQDVEGEVELAILNDGYWCCCIVVVAREAGLQEEKGQGVRRCVLRVTLLEESGVP